MRKNRWKAYEYTFPIFITFLLIWNYSKMFIQKKKNLWVWCFTFFLEMKKYRLNDLPKLQAKKVQKDVVRYIHFTFKQPVE